jgi:ubiquitin-protein ligase
MVSFEENITNTSLIHVSSRDKKFQTGVYALSQDARATAKQKGRGRRVLNELRQIILNPIPGVVVYLLEHDIFEWKVFIEGPGDTPYGGHIWPLGVIFGDGYPAEPPLLRFSTIPYHMNVSEDGIVCISIVTTQYVQTVAVSDILWAICDMFRNPQERLAVQIEKLWDYREFQEEYIWKAEESGENTNDDMETELIAVKITDDPKFLVTAGPAPPPVAFRDPDPLAPPEPVRLYDDTAKFLVDLGESEILMD